MDQLECEDCGATEDLMETYCPYAQEIHDEEIEVILCGKCYHERCMDI